MDPVSQIDGQDGPALVDELVRGVAAVIEDVDAGSEYPVG
jgi:hypothetical protein